MTTTIQTKSPFVIISTQDTTNVLQNNSTLQKSLNATKAFIAGSVIEKFAAGTIVDSPTYLTVQIDINKHITLLPEYLQYINHSCNPNVFFDTTTYELIALQNIEVGEELTFFYPSTEWDMTQSFTCNCGYVNCLGVIKGAKYLSEKNIATYKLTNFIQSMLHKK